MLIFYIKNIPASWPKLRTRIKQLTVFLWGNMTDNGEHLEWWRRSFLGVCLVMSLVLFTFVVSISLFYGPYCSQGRRTRGGLGGNCLPPPSNILADVHHMSKTFSIRIMLLFFCPPDFHKFRRPWLNSPPQGSLYSSHWSKLGLFLEF